MYSLNSFKIKMLLLLLVLISMKIVQVSTAPKNITEYKDMPFKWCDEDYPVTDLIDAYNADDVAADAAVDNDDDIEFEEISFWVQNSFSNNLPLEFVDVFFSFCDNL